MEKISLNGEWDLCGKRENESNGEMIYLKATVPGCVQLELSENGYLPKDLYFGENILEAEKFEDYEWWYEKKILAPDERERVFIVFEGVDCIAEYYLNGKKIGESENMLISHEFEIGEYLKDGENILKIHISSSVIALHKSNFSISQLTSWGPCVETAIRRAPHSYGWDIMPRMITAGIWRDVRLEVRDKIYFSQLSFRTNPTDCTVFYELNCDWENFEDIEIEAEGGCKESTFYARKKIPKSLGKVGMFPNPWQPLPIKNPKLWWPYGYGEPNVYDAVFRIYQKGKLIHEQSASFGLKSVELDRTDYTDGVSGKFRFIINGVEIMCKGSNWVPLDAFHCHDNKRYATALGLVSDIGCNILRCWGGNVYEDHEFFDYCDRNGIMVWQDFSMACRKYPQNKKFYKLMEDEVTSVVRKLRNHPSIILWAGDNEVDEMSDNNPDLNSITREIIAQAVAKNDICRPYLPSSPYISKEVFESGGRLTASELHLWGPRDYFKSDFYKQNKAHFVSETGYHGCPSLESIKKFISANKVWPYQNNSEWILHSSDQKGDDSRVMLMENQVRQLFGKVPDKPEDYIIASQISQAEAKKYFIERMRVCRPNKTGIIWWNLLDGWPQMSDAVVDYYFTKKLAYGYIKRSQAPFSIVAGEISDWHLPIFLCNDTLTENKGYLTIKDAETDEILIETEFIANANATTKICRIPMYYSDKKILIIEWKSKMGEGINHYLCGYPPFDFEKYIVLMKKYNLLG